MSAGVWRFIPEHGISHCDRDIRHSPDRGHCEDWFWALALGDTGNFHITNVTTATCGFILGAVFSGFLLHHPTLEIDKPYGRILSGLGLFLIVAHFTFAPYPMISIAIASAVCGAQNALASRYRGVVLRTTHLTGLFTDFGIHLGMKFRGYKIEDWKLSIPIFITLSFQIGAVVSSAFVLHDRGNWLLLTGMGYLLGGFIWSVYKRLRRTKPALTVE